MFYMDQFMVIKMESVEITTAGMVMMAVCQSKQLSMDMEKQDWTLEIATILVMSESF